MSVVPKEVEMSVASTIFQDMECMEWDRATPAQRSAKYSEWVRDERVGGRLVQFMLEERARVWIKDGPVKEWRRAKYGLGRFADIVPKKISPSDILYRALGADWCMLDGTLKSKPFRFLARRSNCEDLLMITWGQKHELKHMLWSVLVDQARGGAIPWQIIIVDSFVNPTPADEVALNKRIADVANCPVIYIEM